MRDELQPLQHAVLVASLVPEGLPERIAATAVITVATEGGPGATEFEAWGAQPSGSAQADRVARLASQAREGRVDDQLLREVGREFGDDGLVAVFGIAGAIRMFDRVRQPLLRVGGHRLPPVLQGDDNRETLIQIRKSFGSVPDVWKVLSRQPALLSRWWGLHEALLVPDALTGDEKRLAAIGAARAYGLIDLADAYLPQLPNWTEEEVSMALTVETLRVRRGVRSALTSIMDYAVGGMDSEHFELMAAALSGEDAGWMEAIVGFFSGLAVFDRLS